MNSPFFSIIVASFNAENKIRATIDSVLNQTFEDYEIIVKDGGSTDNTLSEIPINDKIRVFSSRDGGIYFGMNEGIDYARGKYLCFLNCGDFFYDKYVLENVYKTAINCDSQSVVYGDFTKKGLVSTQPKKLSPFYLYRKPLCHQSIFTSKEVFDRHGKYDPSIKICADWCYILKTFKNGVKYTHCGKIICDYEGGGASETKDGLKQIKLDNKRIEEFFTKKELFAFKTYMFFSLVWLRKKISSSNSPKWLRKLYKGIANIINR